MAMSRQAEISAESRARLIDAARALFAEDGTRKTTVQAIAERAGISRGSIAWHFGSKQGLVAAVVTDAFDWLVERGSAVLDAPGQAGWDRLTEVRSGMAGGERLLVLTTITVEAVLEKEEEVLRAFAAGQEKVRSLYADYLRRNALTPPGTDPMTAARALQALTLGINIQHRFDDSAISLREAISVLRGISLSPSAPE
jgi:TetR/AcrR family acrAB operon transcriptional repressor